MRHVKILMAVLTLALLPAFGSPAQSAEYKMWPTCEMDGCGAYKGCPRPRPLCCEISSCDFEGNYHVNPPQAMICCLRRPPTIDSCLDVKPGDYHYKFCQCVCRNRDKDPDLKEGAAHLSCEKILKGE